MRKPIKMPISEDLVDPDDASFSLPLAGDNIFTAAIDGAEGIAAVTVVLTGAAGEREKQDENEGDQP